MKKGLLLFLACLLFFSVSGCQSAKTEPEPATVTTLPNPNTSGEQKPPTTDGHTLRLSMRIPQTLNPLLNEEETVDAVLRLVFLPLLRLDAQQKPAPSLAEAWSYGADGRTLSLQLRSGLSWHDQTPITADDVVFSLDTLRSAGENAIYKDTLGYIASYQKTGTYSLSITFSESFSGNLYALCFPVIPARHYRGENNFTSTANMSPVGSGPYAFSSFVPAKELVLTRSDASARIETIHAQITPDANTDLYAFHQGLLDALPTNVTDLGSYDGAAKTKLFPYSTGFLDLIGFNHSRTLWQDVSIRQAVAYALPRAAILESIYLGHAALTDTLVHPDCWYYAADATSYPYSIDEAKKRLSATGWQDTDRDGVLTRTTNQLQERLQAVILVNEENEARRQIALRLADELRVVGFEVRVDALPYDAYVERLAAGDFDLYLAGWELSVVPDFSFLLHSSATKDTNYGSFSNETMDGLLDAAYKATEDAQIEEAYLALQKEIATTLPYIGIAYRDFAICTQAWVQGNIQPLEYQIYESVPSWFLQEATTGP